MSADGTMEIKFSKYENKEGKVKSGTCCDSYSRTRCNNECDHQFYICLGHKIDSQIVCDIGENKTQIFLNQNVIHFQGNDQYHKPFKFSKWQVRKFDL